MTSPGALNRAERRAIKRAAQRAGRPVRRPKADIDAVPLRAVPWRVREVFLPIERILDGIMRDGAVDAIRGKPVFREPETGWYEFVPALRGIIEFHELAAAKHGVALDSTPLHRFAASLEAGKPLTENEVRSARQAIEAMRALALAHMTVGEAKSLLTTVRISGELEKLEGKAA